MFDGELDRCRKRDGAIRAASFYHKSVFEGSADDFLGQFARTAVEPQHHAPSTHGKFKISVALSDFPKALAQDPSFTSARLLPLKVPLCSPGRQTSNSGLSSKKGQRQPTATEGLRQKNDVWRYIRKFKTKKISRSPAARLNIVDNEEDAILFANPLERLQPVFARLRAGQHHC